MTNIDPALIEDPPSLIGKTLRIGKRPPINPKQPRILIIYDIALDRLIHVSSPAIFCSPPVPLS
jgi:hypothetical protein